MSLTEKLIKVHQDSIPLSPELYNLFNSRYSNLRLAWFLFLPIICHLFPIFFPWYSAQSPWSFARTLAYDFASELLPRKAFFALKFGIVLSIVACAESNNEEESYGSRVCSKTSRMKFLDSHFLKTLIPTYFSASDPCCCRRCVSNEFAFESRTQTMWVASRPLQPAYGVGNKPRDPHDWGGIIAVGQERRLLFGRPVQDEEGFDRLSDHW